jgi:hypothetical protein
VSPTAPAVGAAVAVTVSLMVPVVVVGSDGVEVTLAYRLSRAIGPAVASERKDATRKVFIFRRWWSTSWTKTAGKIER